MMGTSNVRGQGALTTSEWQTQYRISRCRDLGYCVIKVREFDVDTPDAPARVGFRVYREAVGFPVGAALASFESLREAQRHAERLGEQSQVRARGPAPFAGKA